MTPVDTKLPALARPLPARRSFGQTSRTDTWWLQPLVVFLVFLAFIVYSTWAGLQGDNYWFGPYLSPFYSPEFWGESPHAWFDGARPPWWPAFLFFSPAFLIVWAPVLFRLTCYYYRGAYYKAWWADPPSCAVGEPRKSYLGENSFPLIVQNVHRYFLPFALLLVAFLTYDAWRSFWFTDEATGVSTFGIGVGTLVVTLNAILLGGYTFGCHSLRHLVGGRLTNISEKPLSFQTYRGVSAFNRRHMLWAWMSLVWVGFTDVYIRLCAMGIWTDWRIL